MVAIGKLPELLDEELEELEELVPLADGLPPAPVSPPEVPVEVTSDPHVHSSSGVSLTHPAMSMLDKHTIEKIRLNKVTSLLCG